MVRAKRMRESQKIVLNYSGVKMSGFKIISFKEVNELVSTFFSPMRNLQPGFFETEISRFSKIRSRLF